MAKDTQAVISPSPSARSLFSAMVMYANPVTLHLSLADTLALAADRSVKGKTDTAELYQLAQQHWIRPADDGGWQLI